MIFRKHMALAFTALFITLLLINSAAAQRKHPAEGSRTARDFRTSITVENDSRETIKLYTLDRDGARRFLQDLEGRERAQLDVNLLEPLLVTDSRGDAVGLYYPDAQPRTIRITARDLEDNGDRDDKAGRDRDDDKLRRDRDDRYYDDEAWDDYEQWGAKYDTKPITICSNQKIPRGFVVISSESEWDCPNWSATGKNAYTIKRPSLTGVTTICSNQDVPYGFLVVASSNEWGCPNWSATGKNAYSIKRASRTEATLMCAVQPVPRGFVVTGASGEWGCPNWSATGKNAYTIRRPRDEEEICSVSDVPRGYVVTSESNSWSCPNWTATGKNAKRIRRIR